MYYPTNVEIQSFEPNLPLSSHPGMSASSEDILVAVVTGWLLWCYDVYYPTNVEIQSFDANSPLSLHPGLSVSSEEFVNLFLSANMCFQCLSVLLINMVP